MPDRKAGPIAANVSLPECRGGTPAGGWWTMPNTGKLGKYSSHISLQRCSVSTRTFVCCRGVIDAYQTTPGYYLRIQRSKHVNARILLWNVRLDNVAFFAKRVRFNTKVSDQHRNLRQMDQVGRCPIVVGALFLQLFESVSGFQFD
ncbi:hypothetical protein [Ruegeria denitrificans]|uniref:hypothetical protein n=1 Tax=Ruegeria denitrificans TaxID=1715692 RepID=UPI00103F0AB5|nr:hypothetical protein [Ruegeria denitrificans]